MRTRATPPQLSRPQRERRAEGGEPRDAGPELQLPQAETKVSKEETVRLLSREMRTERQKNSVKDVL